MRKLLLLAAAVSLTASAQAAEKEKEAAAELELGAATEWALPGGGFSFGPSVGIEFTPIKDWLEIEAGVSPVFGGGRTEWSTELVFKKPFSLSDKVEMMVGLGPEWLYKTGHGETTNSIGGVALVDFQIWPFPERKFGWFVEPSYGYDFGRQHEQSFGVTVGLLIPIREFQAETRVERIGSGYTFPEIDADERTAIRRDPTILADQAGDSLIRVGRRVDSLHGVPVA